VAHFNLLEAQDEFHRRFQWLRRARSNLARASQGQVAPDVLFEDPCFNAQQAAEKALKALLVLKGVQVPGRTPSAN